MVNESRKRGGRGKNRGKTRRWRRHGGAGWWGEKRETNYNNFVEKGPLQRAALYVKGRRYDHMHMKPGASYVKVHYTINGKDHHVRLSTDSHLVKMGRTEDGKQKLIERVKAAHKKWVDEGQRRDKSVLQYLEEIDDGLSPSPRSDRADDGDSSALSRDDDDDDDRRRLRRSSMVLAGAYEHDEDPYDYRRERKTKKRERRYDDDEGRYSRRRRGPPPPYGWREEPRYRGYYGPPPPRERPKREINADEMIHFLNKYFMMNFDNPNLPDTEKLRIYQGLAETFGGHIHLGHAFTAQILSATNWREFMATSDGRACKALIDRDIIAAAKSKYEFRDGPSVVRKSELVQKYAIQTRSNVNTLFSDPILTGTSTPELLNELFELVQEGYPRKRPKRCYYPAKNTTFENTWRLGTDCQKEGFGTGYNMTAAPKEKEEDKKDSPKMKTKYGPSEKLYERAEAAEIEELRRQLVEMEGLKKRVAEMEAEQLAREASTAAGAGTMR